MGEFQPIEIKVKGTPHLFDYESTEAHIYRLPEEAIYNHVVTTEHGTHRLYVFDTPRLIMYLSGIPLPDDELTPKEMKKLTTEMDKRVGWNCKTILEDIAPDEVKERYIRLASVALQGCDVFPEEWAK